jgi:hypothetical protein
MSDSATEIRTPASVTPSATSAVTAATDSTDRPIPLWPEGVVALVAGIALLVVGLRHRVYLQRKGKEVQHLVNEFQRQGGLDELKQMAQQASEFLKG